MYTAAVFAILGHAVDHWTDFDAYCLFRGGGIDPLELTSRRLCSAAWAFLVEGMDQETKDKLISQLFDKSYVEENRTSSSSAHDATGTVALAPKERWRAPPGWRPAGWNEEVSYRTAVGFMGFQATLNE